MPHWLDDKYFRASARAWLGVGADEYLSDEHLAAYALLLEDLGAETSANKINLSAGIETPKS